jgi:hypothetical protein
VVGWFWTWSGNEGDRTIRTESGNEDDRAESGDQLSDEDGSDEDGITHAVPFKCIGAAREKNYQHHFGTGIPCSSLARA